MTDRESQIIAALAAGRTLKEIAFEMNLSGIWIRRQVCDMRMEHGYRTTAQMMWDLARRDLGKQMSKP